MSSSIKESHTSSARRKKEAPAFLHDADACHDDKILKLRAKGGWAWYGLYWACIEAMRRRSDLTIQKDGLDGLALSLATSEDELKKFLDCCAQIGLLESSETAYWSESLLRRMDAYAASVQQRSNAGKASAAKRAQPSLNENPTVVEVPSNDPNRTITILEPVLEINGANGEGAGGGDRDAVPEIQKPPPPRATDIIPIDEELERYNKHLVPYESITDQRDLTIFMSSMRRPMKKYPLIRLTACELRDKTKSFTATGLPEDKAWMVFQAVQNWAKDKQQSGTIADSTASAVDGWALTKVLDQLTKANNLQSSEQRLNGAKR